MYCSMTVVDESTLSLTSILDTLLLHALSALGPIKPFNARPLTSKPKLSLSLDSSDEE